jgi:GNAT superfamily N-acetyltransferase
VTLSPLNEEHTLRFVEGYSATDKMRDLGNGYVLHRGRYPERHAHHEQKHGALIVAVHGGLVVGVARMAFFWVHADHRKTGIGSELHAEFVAQRDPVVFTIEGHKVAASREYATSHQHRVTPTGLKMLKRTYAILVERGVINP